MAACFPVRRLVRSYCHSANALALAAIGYLILFHLRRPRLILLTPHLSSQPAHPHEPDSLLQRKEREMQRRLSGRRVWSDVAVFGVMGPVGIVLIGRGVVALVRG